LRLKAALTAVWKLDVPRAFFVKFADQYGAIASGVDERSGDDPPRRGEKFIARWPTTRSTARDDRGSDK
jgi:hypothetical protein